MHVSLPPTLDGAAEIRRRELPVTVALVVLTGGLSSAILGAGGPIGWAALMVPLLILDTELYRRLDAAEAKPKGRLLWLLSGWAAAVALVYAILPMALWLSGTSAACAAAMVLWIAGVIRQLGVGAGAPLVAFAGAAPPALSLLLSPVAMVVLSDNPDWDLAVIAAVGGGALMAYVAKARIAAEEAERALRARIRADESEGALAWLAIEQAPFEACLVDRDMTIAAMTRAMRRAWSLEAEEVAGRAFDDVFAWRPPHWRQALSKALAGETVLRAEDVVATPLGVRWLVWEARPWRDARGEARGALMSWRDVTAHAEARRAAEQGAATKPGALVIDSSPKTSAHARESLERAGFAVRLAVDADEAVTAIETARPALVVLDLTLSDGAGWRLLQALTTSPATKSVAIIAVSAATDRAEALSFGACEHLIKPVERERLASAALRFARIADQKPAVVADVVAPETRFA